MSAHHCFSDMQVGVLGVRRDWPGRGTSVLGLARTT